MKIINESLTNDIVSFEQLGPGNAKCFMYGNKTIPTQRCNLRLEL